MKKRGNFRLVLVVVSLLAFTWLSQVMTSNQTARAIADRKNEITNLSGKNLGKFKSYMSYKALTNKDADQYLYQNPGYVNSAGKSVSGETKNGKYGIRHYNGLPMVAMSTMYGNIGDIVEIRFSGGGVLRAVIGDWKHNDHVEHTWGSHKDDGSIVEFITDPDAMDPKIRESSNFNSYPEFEGYVVEIAPKGKSLGASSKGIRSGGNRQIDKADYMFYSNNNILFFNPNEEDCIPGSGSGTSTAVEGNDNRDKIANFLFSKNLSAAAVAGVIANAFAESEFNPNIPGQETGTGPFGLFQWLGGRRADLENYAKEKGKEPSDFELQLEFLWKEISEKYQSDVNQLNNLTDPVEAAVKFELFFEVCVEGQKANGKSQKDAEEDCHLQKRKDYAAAYYPEIKDNPAPTGPILYNEGSGSPGSSPSTTPKINSSLPYCDDDGGGGGGGAGLCGKSMTWGEYVAAGNKILPGRFLEIAQGKYPSGEVTPWAYNYYAGGDTYEMGACGPTSVAMAVSNLTNKVVDPVTVGNVVISQGQAFNNHTPAMQQFGLRVETISKNGVSSSERQKKIDEVLAAGGLIFSSGRYPGSCSDSNPAPNCGVAHFYLIRCKTPQGTYLTGNASLWKGKGGQDTEFSWETLNTAISVPQGTFAVYGN